MQKKLKCSTVFDLQIYAESYFNVHLYYQNVVLTALNLKF